MAVSTFYTIGHSTLALDDFLALLSNSAIECVVDVRRLPGSSRYPQFNLEPLRQSLHAVGIGYVTLRDWPAAGAGNRLIPLSTPVGKTRAFTITRITACSRSLRLPWAACWSSASGSGSPSSAPKPSGGAATAASSVITCWPPAKSCYTSWATIAKKPG